MSPELLDQVQALASRTLTQANGGHYPEEMPAPPSLYLGDGDPGDEEATLAFFIFGLLAAIIILVWIYMCFGCLHRAYREATSSIFGSQPQPRLPVDTNVQWGPYPDSPGPWSASPSFTAPVKSIQLMPDIVLQPDGSPAIISKVVVTKATDATPQMISKAVEMPEVSPSEKSGTEPRYPCSPRSGAEADMATSISDADHVVLHVNGNMGPPADSRASSSQDGST